MLISCIILKENSYYNMCLWFPKQCDVDYYPHTLSSYLYHVDIYPWIYSHVISKSLWYIKCLHCFILQGFHIKVFFWLLVQDRLSTRNILRRKNMQCSLQWLLRGNGCWNLMCWSIRSVRTSLIFRGEAVSLHRCKHGFKEVFGWVILRAKKKHFPLISEWLEQLV